jgi:ATP-dependent DNA helicase PIF1
MEFRVKYSPNPLKLKTSTDYIIAQKIPESIILKVGAQVMITRNLDFDLGIVNGTRCVVLSFSESSVLLQLANGMKFELGYFHVKPDPFDTILVDNKLDFKYLPLIHSWALSIHKSQGMTIDSLEVDLGESIFASGQAYTAISRAKSLNSINITKVNKRSFVVSPSVIEFYEKYT